MDRDLALERTLDHHGGLGRFGIPLLAGYYS